MERSKVYIVYPTSSQTKKIIKKTKWRLCNLCVFTIFTICIAIDSNIIYSFMALSMVTTDFMTPTLCAAFYSLFLFVLHWSIIIMRRAHSAHVLCRLLSIWLCCSSTPLYLYAAKNIYAIVIAQVWIAKKKWLIYQCTTINTFSNEILKYRIRVEYVRMRATFEWEQRKSIALRSYFIFKKKKKRINSKWIQWSIQYSIDWNDNSIHAKLLQ